METIILCLLAGICICTIIITRKIVKKNKINIK